MGNAEYMGSRGESADIVGLQTLIHPK